MQRSSTNPTNHDLQPKRPFSGSTMTMISINIEGLTPEKENILAELCKTSECEVLCLQETHRETNHRRPKINGMRLVVERPHSKYGKCYIY